MSLCGVKWAYEVLNGKLPTYEHLRVFGSFFYAQNQEGKVTNLLAEVRSMRL